jgi:hypothetical protein
MKWLLALIAFVLGVAVGIWHTSHHPRRNTLHLVVDGAGNVNPMPQPGDTIKWTTLNNGSPVTVKIASFGSGNDLCSEGNTTSTCTVQAKSGLYPYTCPGCNDPVISPGSTTKPMLPGAPPAAYTGTGGTTSSWEYAMVSCDNGVSKITGYYPDDAPGDTVPPGENIVWSAGNGSGTVTLDPATCTQQTGTIDMNNGQCTVASGWNSPQTYKLNLDSCGQGTATLQLQTSSPAMSAKH